MVLAHCGWCSLIIVAKRREPQDAISSNRAADVCPLLSSALTTRNVRGHVGERGKRLPLLVISLQVSKGDHTCMLKRLTPSLLQSTQAAV